MPYRITWEPPHGVYREYLGDVTIAERRESLALICSDPRFDDLRYAITDFLAVEQFENNKAATEETAALLIGPTTTNPFVVMAAVATRADILAAIDTFNAFAFTNTPYRAHATLEHAREWIAAMRVRRRA